MSSFGQIYYSDLKQTVNLIMISRLFAVAVIQVF